MYTAYSSTTINPQHMHEGYGSHCVCVSVCLSVTTLAATNLVHKSQVRRYKVLYGISNACTMWISLKMLCSPVLASFAFSCCLHDKFSIIYWMNNRDSDGFFQEGLVCMSSDSSYNSTSSSLIIANCQQRFLPFSLI